MDFWTGSMARTNCSGRVWPPRDTPDTSGPSQREKLSRKKRFSKKSNKNTGQKYTHRRTLLKKVVAYSHTFPFVVHLCCFLPCGHFKRAGANLRQVDWFFPSGNRSHSPVQHVFILPTHSKLTTSLSSLIIRRNAFSFSPAEGREQGIKTTLSLLNFRTRVGVTRVLLCRKQPGKCFSPAEF